MHISVQKKIRVGFFIAFTIIVGATVLSYLIAKNLMHNANQLNHAIEVSKKLEVITKQLKDAEAAIRGYNLTKQTDFLHPSMEERSIRIENEYRTLRRIMTDSVQQKNLDTLKQLLDIKYKQLTAGEQKDVVAGASISVGEKALVVHDRALCWMTRKDAPGRANDLLPGTGLVRTEVLS